MENKLRTPYIRLNKKLDSSTVYVSVFLIFDFILKKLKQSPMLLITKIR